MDFAPGGQAAPGVHITRATLSIGAFDLLQFTRFEHAFPRHAHDHYTVAVFDRPHGWLEYRGRAFHATPNGVLAVSADDVHAAEPETGGWTYRALYPTVDVIATALDDPVLARRASFPAPVFEDAALAASLRRLHAELRDGAEGIGVETELLGCMRHLVGAHSTERARTRSPAAARRAAELARDYLEANYGKTIKLRPLAELCGVSPFHLVRSFRQIIGLPPHAYLTQLRANRARELLLRGESLSTATYSCGFCDQSHMTRTFKRIFGVTPGAYVDALPARSRAKQRLSS